MGWFSRIASRPKQPQPSRTRNPVAIPAPRGWPTGDRLIYPVNRGKTPEQFAADLAIYKGKMAAKSAAISEFDAERAVSIGCTSYIWRSSRDEAVCPTCRAHDGKRFSYAKAPKAGHPGAVTCCDQGWCRCTAEAVLPQ